MKFKLYREKLKYSLNKLRSSLAQGSINPVLEHFLFEVKGSHLSLKATNMNISAIWDTKVDNEDGSNFTFTVPGSTLANLISNLGQDVISFEYNESTQDVTLTCGSYIWESSSGNINSFPNLDIPDDLNVMELPKNFNSDLKRVLFAVSKDLTKPDLNSLCIDINKDNSKTFRLLATDRIRLSYSEDNTSYTENYLQFVIPRTSAMEILKLEPSHLMYPDDLKSIYFKLEDPSGTYTLRTSLTNAKYPDIYAYINNSFESPEVVVSKRDLVSSIKRLKTTVDNIDKIATFEILENKVRLLSTEVSSKSVETIKATTPEGAPSQFKVRLNLLQDYLSEDESEDVKFKIIENMCLVFDKENYRHVLSIER